MCIMRSVLSYVLSSEKLGTQTSSPPSSLSYRKEHHGRWRLSSHTQIRLYWQAHKVVGMHVTKKQPPTKFHLQAFREWLRALGKKLTCSLVTESKFKKNWHAIRVFLSILSPSVENTIPWQTIWFTLYKEHGDVVKLHNHLSQKGPE